MMLEYKEVNGVSSSKNIGAELTRVVRDLTFL
jgi:hypothetical protein